MEQLTDFQIWWEAFPKGDGFTISGKKFPRTRALRLNEKACKKEFENILRKGFTVDQMLHALYSEIESRKKESLQTGTNKMRFMQNSQAYLNAGGWEFWMEDEDDIQERKEIELIDPEDLF